MFHRYGLGQKFNSSISQCKNKVGKFDLCLIVIIGKNII